MTRRARCERAARKPVDVLATVMFVAGAALVATAPRAGASCIPALVQISPIEAAPGDTITLEGDHFGDDCHDTGPPPAGEGPLGRPLVDITIFIVQDAERILVAKGDADAEYTFEVGFPVPSGLEAGPARVELSWSARFVDSNGASSDGVVTIADRPPRDGSAAVTLVRFGPRHDRTSSMERSDDSTAPAPVGSAGSDADDAMAVGLAVVMASLACALVVLLSSRPTDARTR